MVGVMVAVVVAVAAGVEGGVVVVVVVVVAVVVVVWGGDGVLLERAMSDNGQRRAAAIAIAELEPFSVQRLAIAGRFLHTHKAKLTPGDLAFLQLLVILSRAHDPRN